MTDKQEFTDKLIAAWKEKTGEDKLPRSKTHAEYIVANPDKYDVETIHMAEAHLWSLNAYELLGSMIELVNALVIKKEK